MVVQQQRQKQVPMDPDPLQWAWGPPANETPSQRAVRKAEENAARLISDRIDEEMMKERYHTLKERPIKVILLGQEGSEKSALLRGFRESYAQQACQRENLVWRAVIRLNLVRSVNNILDALGNDHRAPQLDKLRKRLSPLRRAQRDLEKHLGLTEGEEIRTTAIPQLVQHGQQLEKAMKLVISSRSDITVLWGDDGVRAVLETHGTLLDEHSRFFLDNIDRIMEQGYEPSDDDVSRVRPRTVPGVQEYHYLVDNGPDAGPGSQWIFYDVGYSRTQRVSWIPYLMEANALVFLASLSVFDQSCKDDPRINRLEDTFRLWTVICKSSLLSKMHLILVLSGCDELRAKLEGGVRLRRYITSYGDRPNDLISAVKYFHTYFKWVFHKDSADTGLRKVYIHSTASDGPDRHGHLMRVVMVYVRDGIFHDDLRNARLLD